MSWSENFHGWMAKWMLGVLVGCAGGCFVGFSYLQIPEQEASIPQESEAVIGAEEAGQNGETQDGTLVPLSNDFQGLPAIDPKSDPLFQEIQKMILGRSENGSQHLPGDRGGLIPEETEAKLDTIEPTRWQAVESILAGARLLEQEMHQSVQQGKFEKAMELRSAIRVLRGQALGLLR